MFRLATALLERTRLHVRVKCQAIHAKNARHMLIDLIDYFAPTLVIIGSRGLSRLKGIILGSVSHYLIQKSSAPVMVSDKFIVDLPYGNCFSLTSFRHDSSNRSPVVASSLYEDLPVQSAIFNASLVLVVLRMLPSMSNLMLVWYINLMQRQMARTRMQIRADCIGMLIPAVKPSQNRNHLEKPEHERELA